MADIAVSIIAKLSEYLVDPILNNARYVFGFNQIVRGLYDQKDELIVTQKSVKERMKEARRKTEIIEEAVERWMNDVNNVLKDVEKLEEKTKDNKGCYRVPFQYFLAKEAENATKRMKNLYISCIFEPFSRRTELPGMKYFSSKNFVYSKSTEHAYNKLMEALKDGKCNMIGFHGMGGSGKTTLVKEVGKKAEELQLFDKVVMAVVSHNPEVTNIQGQIADSLDLILREETTIGRAQRLSTSLQVERTLVILDDVWENLDFEAIGIPPCCTVLLATRGRDVCVSMNCQITVELSLLDEEEAWTLFKRCADIIDDSPYALKLKNVPRKIAKKCKGLPIAIVTMASMLRGKKVEEWELALLRLEESQEIDVEEVLSSCYACIKLSYDNLTKQVSKNLFLLCSIFPEDYEINMEDLVRYIKGLGPSAGTIGTMEKVRREIQVTMNILKDSYLLQPCGKQEFVKMHDLVRDAALWIASKEGKAIKIPAKTLVAVEENVKEIAAMSLWSMENLPSIDQLQCSALKTLLLHSTDESSLQLPKEYFGKMQMLEVLGITKFYYTWRNLYTLRYLSSSLSIFAVPQSMERLTMLRTLCLRGYDLGDISILASLTRLEILDLRSSSFDELPQGITTLQKLRLLDIYTCRIKKNNPYEVIRKCTQLEELYIWRVEDDSLPLISLPRLHRYVIVCDKFRENCRFLIDAYLEDHVPSRALCIDQFDASALIHDSSSIKDLFLRCC